MKKKLIGLLAFTLLLTACGTTEVTPNDEQLDNIQIESSDNVESSALLEDDAEKDVTALTSEEKLKESFKEYDPYRDIDMEIDFDLSAFGKVANDIWKNNGTAEDLAKYLQNIGVTEIYQDWPDKESIPFNFDDIMNRKYINEDEDGEFYLKLDELKQYSLKDDCRTYTEYMFNGNGKLYIYTIRIINPSDEAKKNIADLAAQLIETADTNNQIYIDQYDKDYFLRSNDSFSIKFWLGPDSDKEFRGVDRAASMELTLYDKEISIDFTRTYYN